MRSLILIACFLCVGFSAMAETAVLAIDDDQLTMNCIGYGTHGDPLSLTYGGGFHDRCVMVFDKNMFPENFESVGLKLVAHSSNNSSIMRLTLFTSPSPGILGAHWEYRMEEFFYIGTFEVPPSPPNTFVPHVYDVLEAINFAEPQEGQFVFIKISNTAFLCDEPECSRAFASLNSPEGQSGPELIFGGVVPTQSESMGDVKSMYR